MKILLGFVLFLALISGIFLILAKPKNSVKPARPVGINQDSQKPANNLPAPAQNKTPNVTAPISTKNPATVNNPKPTAPKVDRNKLNADQWKQCREKTLSADTKLLWRITITQASAVGGGYANGNLNGDISMPVQVYAKPGSENTEEIKEKLMNAGTLLLRGTCMGNAGDGNAILFEAF